MSRFTEDEQLYNEFARAATARPATCFQCGREIVYDASADAMKWVHWVEPVPDGHPASPIIGAKEVRCPKCAHSFVALLEAGPTFETVRRLVEATER